MVVHLQTAMSVPALLCYATRQIKCISGTTGKFVSPVEYQLAIMIYI